MISAAVLAVGWARQTSEEDQDQSMLQSILEGVLASDVDEVICITDDLAPVRRHIKLIDSRLFWHLNSAAFQGRSSSVIAGLWASHPRSDAVIFVACEPPVVGTALINSMIEKTKTSVASIIVATLAGQPRGPLLFRRELFPEILELTGDETGASLLEKHAQNTALVPWQEQPGPAIAHRRATAARLKERV